MRQMIFRVITRWAILCALCLQIIPGRADESSPPAYVPDSKKQDAWLFGKNRTYDEWFVQQRPVHTKDPYIWVYNEDFANDFGMPDRWIDKDLKGADALAFRTDKAFPMCGWNGNPDACNVPTDCIVEMYFHQRRNPLPWNEKVRWTDLQLDKTSAWILASLRPFNRIDPVISSRKSPLADPESGADLGWWYVYLPNSGSGGAAFLQSYDRSIFEMYSIVTVQTFCKEYAGLELHDYISVPRKAKIFKSVSFPQFWRDRVRPLMSSASKSDSDFYRKKFEELKGN